MYSSNRGQKWSVAHNWANELQSSYKKDTVAGSLYYEGKTIYSYGRHFPIAVIHTDKKRGNVTFFTTRSYSNTTSKHIHAVRSACSHHELIFCMNPEEGARGYHANNLADWENNCKNIARELGRARKPEIYLSRIAGERNEAQKYAAYWGIKLTAKKLPFLFTESKDGKAVKVMERARKEAEQRREKEFKAELQHFRNFDDINKLPEEKRHLFSVTNPKDHNAAYLRYNADTKRVETSKRVEIPAEIARRFYSWLKNTAKNGGCAGGCQQTILNYRVTSVNANEFKIGCHTIQMTEADTIAKALNWK